MGADVVNIPLLRKAVEWAEAEAAKVSDCRWDQGSWVIDLDRAMPGSPEWAEVRRARGQATCGTAYCIAGYVGQLVDPRFERTDVVHDSDGYLYVQAVAQKALGIDDVAAGRLFHGGNSIKDVRRIAEDIAGGPL